MIADLAGEDGDGHRDSDDAPVRQFGRAPEAKRDKLRAKTVFGRTSRARAHETSSSDTDVTRVKRPLSLSQMSQKISELRCLRCIGVCSVGVCPARSGVGCEKGSASGSGWLGIGECAKSEYGAVWGPVLPAAR